ncbi:hypothetical protein SNE40_006526 [Patella caerulea]|uniref:Uncharacterized protein n=1 Tax=Patella caerulea TaxID=87958 RepID=A0AAN8JW57_PATCE
MSKPWTTPRPDKSAIADELTPRHYDNNHQGSMFGNVRRSRSCFVINPEWVSESVNTPRNQPLSRPPWPWEQPRHRVNMQVPMTYTVMEKPTSIHPHSTIPYAGRTTTSRTYHVQNSFGNPAKGITPIETVDRT